MKCVLILVVWLGVCGASCGQGQVFDVAGARPGVTVSVFWESAPQATATLLLFPGGGGWRAELKEGRPAGDNFLVRTAPAWVAQGFNVAIFGMPSDEGELSGSTRISAAHLSDIRAVLAAIQARSPLPVWLVSTSRGTISASAAAIQLDQGAIAGLVLTSSVLLREEGALPTQALERITVPVLVFHHARDACPVCPPARLDTLMAALNHARQTQLMLFDGGSHPQGRYCGPLHWHGYAGMEGEAVERIAGWIRQTR